jgi:LysM repeat protein
MPRRKDAASAKLMNNPNPFVPKGSILEQQSKRRSRLRLAVFCVLAVSITGLAAILIQGCKREQPVENGDNSTPTIDTNTTPVADTNAPATDTNAPVVSTNPPPTFVEPPPVAPAVTTYTVVKGDILETIAKKNGVTLKALEAANPGVVPTKLQIGQKLVIPAGGSVAAPGVDSTGAVAPGEIYIVKSGDTLTRIARLHSTTVKAIMAENNLTTTRIKVGQKLKIPAKSEPAATETPAPQPAPVVPATSAPATPGATVTN